MAPTKKTATATTKPAAKNASPATTKSTKAVKAAAPAAPAPKAEPVAAAPAPTTEVAEVEKDVAGDLFSDFYSKLQVFSTNFAGLKSDFRLLQKTVSRELRVAKKLNSKRSRKMGKRSPSGFTVPTPVSLELATFLGKPMGTSMARTDVTKEINNYIRANSLQDKTNGRKIIPDAKLATLLKVGKTDELTYFNLQRYMSPHFPKVAKPAADVAAAGASA
jgi:chromatin remodeling complex protein RSC6